jgi:hypothetical protein
MTNISVERLSTISCSQMFLARFFNEEILSAHAMNHLGKSGKGSAQVLAQRITQEWANKAMKLRVAPPTCQAVNVRPSRPEIPLTLKQRRNN